ncbi:unnamed protein product [Clonostachys rosea]|uniref:Uncharacterized protein n=1 Tax=Bionectria ochroleuca TaxID=29856 RepID=A0ABY6TVL2_BIOOC|nr:unnamed protein product [Clonostachys rosea]
MPPPRGTLNLLEGPGDYDVTSVVHSNTYPAIDPKNVNLEGTAVFVSGGSKGLGRAMVLSFAKAGASYIAAGARSDMSQLAKDVAAAAASANRPSPKFLAVTMDVTKEDSVQAAADSVKREFGRCDVLINNAGILGRPALIIDTDPAHWWSIFEVNVRGPYLVSRAFIPLVLESDKKTVINVSSVGAHLRSPTGSAYQTAKLALVRLTEFMDSEYSSKGLVAMSIHPGNSPTDIVGDVSKLPGGIKNALTETVEIAGDSVVYLAAERRAWLGGRYVNVTWDLPELMTKEGEIVKGDKLKVKLLY